MRAESPPSVRGPAVRGPAVLGPAVGGPSVVVLDVNETLSDLDGLRARFTALGAPGHLHRLWFASVLRDGFALAAAGAQESFAVLAEHCAFGVLRGLPLRCSLDDAVRQVMSAFAELDVHPDVPDGLRRLRAGGLHLVTLSNGAAAVADALLTRAGVRGEVEAVLSVEDAGVWKPAPAAYAHAVAACGVPAGELMLVAVHPWDVDGAARAGLRTAWVDRGDDTYPGHLRAPDLRVRSLTDLADALAGSPGPAGGAARDDLGPAGPPVARR